MIKSQKEVTKQQESRFFLLFLLGEKSIRIRIRIHTSGPKTYGSGFESGSATLYQAFLCAPEENQQIDSRRVLYSQNTYTVCSIKYLECLSPRPNWDSPPPIPQASGSPPPPRNQRGRGHTRLRVRGRGGHNADDWRKSLYSTLFTLCNYTVYAINHLSLRCFV
jgi:hypothetical protein